MPDVSGTVSPITSSSSQHEEKDDSHLDYYVKGGDNMADNNISVTEAQDDSYEPGESTTEPDPDGDLAMQKVADDDNDASNESDADEDDIQKKDFSDARRKQLAHEGKAMPDGSYPIESVQDLHNAISSWGRGGSDPKVKAHIISRARALGAYDELPDSWKSDVKKSLWGNAFAPGIPSAAMRAVFRIEE